MLFRTKMNFHPLPHISVHEDFVYGEDHLKKTVVWRAHVKCPQLNRQPTLVGLDDQIISQTIIVLQLRVPLANTHDDNPSQASHLVLESQVNNIPT
mmetsp:Transcript_8930/g.13708  ORF Transcript_8930/g.13708 Transcript_8930/m.13708 type:complete len:96 (-) Transcript_8930:646-933(-)